MRAAPRTWPRVCTNNRERGPPTDTRALPTPFLRMAFDLSLPIEGASSKSDNLRRLSTLPDAHLYGK
jgi:hypothetical protein